MLPLLTSLTALASPRGIVVVSIDGLRPDYTGVQGGSPDTMPFLKAFAKEATVFTQAYAQANETLFSHASMFTSQVPSRLGPVDYDLTITSEVPTLAGALSGAGFRTGAIVAGGHLARVFGLDDGFGQYIEAQNWGSFQETVPMSVNWLKQARDQPFFLFLHSYDVHIPYTKPHVFGRSATPGYQGAMLERADDSFAYERIYNNTLYPGFSMQLLENEAGTRILTPEIRDRLPRYAAQADGIMLNIEDQAFVRGLFETSATYADLWLGVLFSELRGVGLWDDVIIVVMSDHGELLLDHGFVNHRNMLTDAATQVVLMIRHPDQAPKRVDDVVELLDLGSTLLHLVGADVPSSFQGDSLVPCLEQGPCPGDGLAYSEGILRHVSITDGSRRLTVHGQEAALPAVDQALRSQTDITITDNSGPPGSETNTDDGDVQALVDGALKRRARAPQ